VASQLRISARNLGGMARAERPCHSDLLRRISGGSMCIGRVVVWQQASHRRPQVVAGVIMELTHYE
jgi:hypothetical protein